MFAKNGVRSLFAELKTDTGVVSNDQIAWLQATHGVIWRPKHWYVIEKSLKDGLKPTRHRADSEDAIIMASVLDWAYWHLERDTTRRVLRGDDPVLDCISPGQLPPGKPARQVAMSILRGSSFEPWDGDPLAGWHRVTLGVDARAESEAKADPAAAVSPGEWCNDVSNEDPRQPAGVQHRRRAGHQ